VKDPHRAFIEVYVFRRRGRRVEFLCLRRGKVRFLPGVWQPVTGRCRSAERGLRAAAREVREETGLSPSRWWALEAPTVFYDVARDRIRSYPRFVAEVPWDADVRLSSEHVDWAFLPAAEAGRRYLWESQRKGLEDAGRQVLRGGPLADALEVKALPGRPAGRGGGRRASAAATGPARRKRARRAGPA
jgi:dihydroneopterin triphosphate diphosphatase